MKKFLLSAIIVIGCSWAVSAQAFTITPVRFLITVNPGESQVATIEVKNTENKNIIVTPVIVGLKQGTGGQMITEEKYFETQNWVKVNADELNLSPGETKKINFNISVPLGVPPGDRYLGVGVQKAGGEKAVGLSARLIAPISLQVSGTALEKLNIGVWQSIKMINFKKDWVFNLSLQNTGNVEVPVNAVSVLRNWRAQEVASYPVVDNIKVLAGSERVLNTKLSTTGKIFWPGWYQVQVKVNYGLTNQSATALANIIYLPVWFLISLGLIVLCVIGAFTSQYKFQM